MLKRSRSMLVRNVKSCRVVKVFMLKGYSNNLKCALPSINKNTNVTQENSWVKSTFLSIRFHKFVCQQRIYQHNLLQSNAFIENVYLYILSVIKLSIKDGYLQVSKGSPCTQFIIKIDYIPWLYLTYHTSIDLDFKAEESVFATD